jgi:hypothetical protein
MCRRSRDCWLTLRELAQRMLFLDKRLDQVDKRPAASPPRLRRTSSRCTASALTPPARCCSRLATSPIG